MPRCPNGHEQRLGLKCLTCGAELSYRDSLGELRALPKVEPAYGSTAVISVGYPGLSPSADYVAEISAGQADLKTPAAFVVPSIRGGGWLDYNKKHLHELRRWMALVGIGKPTERGGHPQGVGVEHGDELGRQAAENRRFVREFLPLAPRVE